MGAIMSVLGLIMSCTPYLSYAMVQLPLRNKCPKTFGFSLPPHPFSTQNYKIIGAQKNAPKIFDWLGTPTPPPPYGKKTK